MTDREKVLSVSPMVILHFEPSCAGNLNWAISEYGLFFTGWFETEEKAWERAWWSIEQSMLMKLEK
jgi:hypothetical protein